MESNKWMLGVPDFDCPFRGGAETFLGKELAWLKP